MALAERLEAPEPRQGEPQESGQGKDQSAGEVEESEPAGAGEGSTSVTTPDPALNRVGLGTRGTVGNKGGTGKPKRADKETLTREYLLKTAGEASGPYKVQRDAWLEAARLNLTEGKLAAADLCQKRADAIQDSYLKYSVGTRVTTSLDNDAFLMRTEAVLNREITPELLRLEPSQVKLTLARALRDALSE